MKIDKELVPDLDNGIVPDNLLIELINSHITRIPVYNKLDSYYMGNDTLGKTRQLSSSPNNIAIHNYAKYITDINVGYSMSNDVSYTVPDGMDIEPVINEYKTQTILKTDKLNKKSTSKFGVSYEMIYSDALANPRSKNISVSNVFTVRDNTVEENILFAVYYYPIYSSGNIIKYNISIYTDKKIITYEIKSLKDKKLIKIEEKDHSFGQVPIIEIKNNEEQLGDYETVTTLIDAYNRIVSNDLDNIDQFIDSILLLYGASLDATQIQLLKETKGLNLPTDGRAEYLTKVLDETGLNIALTRIKNDIHKFSMTPDISDKEFAGNSSGVALSYKLLPFEISTKDKEAYFKEGLKKRFEIYNYYLNIKSNMPIIDISQLDIKLTRGLPKNDYETSQMINNLDGKITNQTLISLLSFVEDPKKENEALIDEKKENVDTFINNAGDFNNKTPNTADNTDNTSA